MSRLVRINKDGQFYNWVEHEFGVIKSWGWEVDGYFHIYNESGKGMMIAGARGAKFEHMMPGLMKDIKKHDGKPVTVYTSQTTKKWDDQVWFCSIGKEIGH